MDHTKKHKIDNIELDFVKHGDYDELKEAMIEAYQNMPNA